MLRRTLYPNRKRAADHYNLADATRRDTRLRQAARDSGVTRRDVRVFSMMKAESDPLCTFEKYSSTVPEGLIKKASSMTDEGSQFQYMFCQTYCRQRRTTHNLSSCSRTDTLPG